MFSIANECFSGDGFLSCFATGNFATITSVHLLSPRVTLTSSQCLSFRYLNRALLVVHLVKNKNGRDNRFLFITKFNSGIDVWNFVTLDLNHQGSYSIEFKSMVNVVQQPHGASQGFIVSAIDDVILHNHSCENLTGEYQVTENISGIKLLLVNFFFLSALS